jgi:hypothetical protein
MPHEKISLAGQELYVEGPIRANAVSEFTSGLKVGRATYDERLHAFWLVLDDFSGGIGYRRLDIREALGTVWDNVGGVDIRRAGHITLPPLQTVGAMTAPGAADYTKRQPSVPITGSDVSGTPANYAGFGGNIYKSTDGGASWASVKVITGAYMVSRILEFCPSTPAGANALYAFPEGGGGTARYQRSTDGTTWADGGTGTQKVIEDAIVYSSGGQDIIIGTRPIAEIIFSTDGQTWNIDNPLDADVIWKAGYGRIQFVGIFMAPWGAGAVHFLARDDAGLQSLFVLNFDIRSAYLIPINNKRHLHDALVWNNYLVTTDGYNVWLWDGSTVRNISWPRKGGGLPPGLQGGVIVKLIGGTDYLYALLYTGAGATQVLVYNGAGWSQLGPAVAGFCSVVTGICSKWLPATVATERRIVALGTSAFGGAGSPRLMTLRLPDTGEVPVVGLDNFQDGPLSFRTGWIDGGFRELEGCLYRLYCDGYNLSGTETVAVGYRLNNDETAAFTPLGTFVAAGTYFSFAGSTGLQFRTVQFEITLDRTAATKSPELAALVLLYDKKPAFRSTWTFRIDVNQMVAEGIHVGGVAATFKNVWEKLISIWNTKTLVELNIPNVDTSVYVKIADLPTTFDDFRDAVKGRGFVDCTVIEPI